jgi:transcriptional regulator with XRE-family HTH domain
LKDQLVAPTWEGPNLVSTRFGRRLRDLRLSSGMTQMQLAMAARRDRSFISDLERGVKEPTISTLESFAEIFKMTLSELLKGV